MSQKTRVLLTGAGGFLGSQLVREFMHGGQRVIAVSSQPEEDLRQRWVGRSGGCGAELVEICPTQDLFGRPLDDVSVVVNAGFARVPQGRALAEGLEFQARLLQAVRTSNVRRLINVSSQSVYDPRRARAATERTPPSLTSPYATAKLAQELLTEAYLPEIELVHVRLASLIGQGFDQRVVNKLVARALETRSLSITGGDQLFDYMDVRDAARAIASLCFSPLVRSPEVVNVGAGNPTSLQEIAEAVAEVLGEVRGLSVSIEVASADAGVSSSELDCSRLRDQYGFATDYSLRDTIRDIVANA